jgi:hypothetical protein
VHWSCARERPVYCRCHCWQMALKASGKCERDQDLNQKVLMTMLEIKMIPADASQQLLPPNLNQPLRLQGFAATDVLECQTRSCRLPLTHQQRIFLNVGCKIKNTLQGREGYLMGPLQLRFERKTRALEQHFGTTVVPIGSEALPERV